MDIRNIGLSIYLTLAIFLCHLKHETLSLPFFESNPKILFRSDSEAGKNGEEGGCPGSVVVVLFPNPNLLNVDIVAPNWIFPFPNDDAKRGNIGVLDGDGDV